MRGSFVLGWALSAIAIVVAVIALVVAFGIAGGTDSDADSIAVSDLKASVASLSAKVSEFETALDESGQIDTAIEDLRTIRGELTELQDLVEEYELEDSGLHLKDRGEFTVDLVLQAVRHYEENGRQATLDHYSSPDSVVGEWYVFIVGEDDRLVAHPNNSLIGMDLRGPLGVDETGYRYGDVLLGATEQGLWVDYLFLNLTTGNQEFKHSWVIKHDGLIFGSGWYQILPTSRLDPTKEDPAEYTVAFVDRAIRYYRAHGREKAVEFFNSPASVDGLWYVFIIDQDGLMIAHSNPAALGQHVDDLGKTIDDKKFSDLEVTEAGLWVDYVFVNPVTGEEGVKHSWVVRHDDIYVGSDWYE